MILTGCISVLILWQYASAAQTQTQKSAKKCRGGRVSDKNGCTCVYRTEKNGGKTGSDECSHDRWCDPLQGCVGCPPGYMSHEEGNMGDAQGFREVKHGGYDGLEECKKVCDQDVRCNLFTINTRNSGTCKLYENRKPTEDRSRSLYYSCSKAKPEEGSYCLKVRTGREEDDDGRLHLTVIMEQGGENHEFLTGGKLELESEYARCYESKIASVSVWNESNDGWAGTIQYSSDRGSTYHYGVCDSDKCTPSSPGTRTHRIAVDGNDDYKESSKAAVKCSDSSAADTGCTINVHKRCAPACSEGQTCYVGGKTPTCVCEDVPDTKTCFKEFYGEFSWSWWGTCRDPAPTLRNCDDSAAAQKCCPKACGLCECGTHEDCKDDEMCAEGKCSKIVVEPVMCTVQVLTHPCDAEPQSQTAELSKPKTYTFERDASEQLIQAFGITPFSGVEVSGDEACVVTLRNEIVVRNFRPAHGPVSFCDSSYEAFKDNVLIVETGRKQPCFVPHTHTDSQYMLPTKAEDAGKCQVECQKEEDCTRFTFSWKRNAEGLGECHLLTKNDKGWEFESSTDTVGAKSCGLDGDKCKDDVDCLLGLRCDTEADKCEFKVKSLEFATARLKNGINSKEELASELESFKGKAVLRNVGFSNSSELLAALRRFRDNGEKNPPPASGQVKLSQEVVHLLLSAAHLSTEESDVRASIDELIKAMEEHGKDEALDVISDDDNDSWNDASAKKGASSPVQAFFSLLVTIAPSITFSF